MNLFTSVGLMMFLSIALRAHAGIQDWDSYLPKGNEKGTVTRVCKICHTLERVVTSRHTANEWQEYVKLMVQRGAPLPSEKISAVAEYLGSNFGPENPLPPGLKPQGTTELPPGVGRNLVMSKCQDCHDLKLITTSRYSRDGWHKVVASMVGRGAWLTRDQVPVVGDYLAEALPAPNVKLSQKKREVMRKTVLRDDRKAFTNSQPVVRGSISGTVFAKEGQVRAFRVTAHNSRYGIRYTVFTNNGHYKVPQALPGPYEVGIIEDGYSAPLQKIELSPGREQKVDIEVARRPLPFGVIFGDYDELYPPGLGRDMLENVCMGCHGKDWFHHFQRTEAGWRGAIRFMRFGYNFAGSAPLGRTQLSAADEDLIAKYLAANFGRNSPKKRLKRDEYPVVEEAVSKSIYVHYDIAADTPHPTARKPYWDADGKLFYGNPTELLHDGLFSPLSKLVWFTGGSSNSMVRLDPKELNPAKRWKFYPLPTPNAVPHGLAEDSKGNIYFAQVATNMVGVVEAKTDRIREYRIPTSGSQLQVITDQDDNLWYGLVHGSAIGELNAKTKWIRQWAVPTADFSVYGMAIDKDGSIWSAGWAKNMVAKFNPVTQTFTEYRAPSRLAGTRRPGIDSKGIVWVTEFSAGKMLSIDPSTGNMAEYSMPMRYSSPYDVQADAQDKLWISDEFNSSIVAFDQSKKTFTYYPLPQLNWSVPKLSIEPNGTMWFGSRNVPHPGAVHFYPEGFSAGAPPP